MDNKINMSKQNVALIECYNKGYRVVGGAITYRGKTLKGILRKKGYRFISFRMNNGESQQIGVHRLMAYQKFGSQIFGDKIQVRHLDSNKDNNKEDNIDIGTHYDNYMDKPLEMRNKLRMYGMTICKKHDHEKILSLHNQGFSYNEIMGLLNISSSGTISFIIRESVCSRGTNEPKQHPP